MRLSRLLIGLAFGLVLTCPAIARGDTAEEAFARGNSLLAKGDFQEALRAYSAAVRAQRTNQQYAQQFLLVRRVIALRESLDRERDLQRWREIAQALSSFYTSQGIYSEALSLDEKIHAKLNTAASAGQLAETQLAMGRDADAAEVLAAKPSEEARPANSALCLACCFRSSSLLGGTALKLRVSNSRALL